MKWNKHEPHFHEMRIIKKFLWFPKTLDGETRWLETCHIEQRYYLPNGYGCWKDIRWVEQTYK
jgi:hypothetical protein